MKILNTMPSSTRGLSPESFIVLSTEPATQPPTGVESNLLNSKDHNHPFLILNSLLLGIMGLFFMNRLYTKKFIVREFSWDDCKFI